MRAETSATSAIATLSVAVAALGHAVAGGTVSPTALPQLLALAALGWSLGEQVAGRRWLSFGFLGALQLITHLALEASHRTPTSIATAAAGSTDGTAQRAALEPGAVGHAAMGHSSMHDMAGMAGMHDMAGMAGMHDMAGMAGMHDMAGMAMPGVDASAAVGSGSLASAASGGLVDAASGGVAHSASDGLVSAAPGDMAGAMHSGLAGVVSMSAAHLFVLLVGVALVTQAHRWVHRVAGLLARLVPQVPAMPVAVPGVGAVLVGVPEVPRLTQRWLVSGVSRRGPPGCGVLAASY
ncbi:hypothetical protein [Kribbella ginsengisoli]|uniref:Uncharacterized protein n=1 Tax=Kribbella ginsengisoli TaxID=363865 RepID=A0ABP6WIL5_9ACTN